MDYQKYLVPASHHLWYQNSTKTTNQSLGWCAVSYRTTLRLLCSLYTRQ